MILDSLSDTEILGLTIIGEARGEPIEGQVAVGSIIRNRLHSNPKKYKSYRDVCLERSQFSCWNIGDTNRAYLLDLAQRMFDNVQILDIYLNQCLIVAKGIIDWKIVDNTKGAQFYMTTKLFNENRPEWAKLPTNDPKQIGSQIFFNI